MKGQEADLYTYIGCWGIMDVGNGQKQNYISWTRIHEIQRRLGLERMELGGGWSRVMPGSHQVNRS